MRRAQGKRLGYSAAVPAGSVIPGYGAPSARGVPEEIEFEIKPEIPLRQIRQAVEQKVAAGVVLADVGYSNGTPFSARPSRKSDCNPW